MRFLVFLLLAGGTTGCLHAQTALCLVRDGKTYVVQKVARGYAYIQEGDKLVPVNPIKSGLVPVKEFYPVFVSVRDLNVKTSTVALSGSGTNINNEFHFAGTFESAYFLADAFLVLELDMEGGAKRIFYQEIGDLRPGKPQWVRVGVPLSEELGAGKFNLHVFTQGREVFNSLQPWQFREAVLDQMVTKRLDGVKDAPPQPLVGPVPEYPKALRKARLKGEAIVGIRITPRGVVTDPVVVKATDPAFGEAALVAVREWRFMPQVKAGRPVEANVQVPFVFQAPSDDAKH